jgi:hypothetical protein
MSETPTFAQALAARPAKQRAYVLAFLECLNKSEAARRAGYANPGQQGHRLYKHVEIQKVIRLGLAEQVMPADEVLARLTLFATASLEDFISLPSEAGAEDTPLPPEASAEGASPPMPHHWRLDLAKAKRLGKLGALKKLKWGEHGPELELHDPIGPLTTLAKHHGLIVERSREEPIPPIDWSLVPDEMQAAFLDRKLTLAQIFAYVAQQHYNQPE